MIHESIQNVSGKEQSETASLKEWLQGHGVKAVLFDLDDTLLDTCTWERGHERIYLSYVGQKLSEIAPDEFEASFHKAHRAAYLTNSVHSDRWRAIVSTLFDQYGPQAGRVFEDALPILMHIYEDSPPLFPGSQYTLSVFRNASDKVGLVTHAEEAYTYQKLKIHGLLSYFDVVQIADARKYKSKSDWKRAIDALEVRPEEVLVIGDNIKGDIQAAREVGVKYTVALPSSWSVYAEGEIPDGTIQAKNIADVIPKLLEQT